MGNRKFEITENFLFPISYFLYIGVTPCNDVSNRITIIKRVNKIANFSRIPHKRALDFRYGYLAVLYPGQNGLYGMLVN